MAVTFLTNEDKEILDGRIETLSEKTLYVLESNDVDDTLSHPGMVADAKVTGDAIYSVEKHKLSLPKIGDSPDYGIAGQVAISDGKGGITWKTLVMEAEEVNY